MDILQAIMLGVVQGLTEFLPVSSSGHLIVFPELFGWEKQGFDFDAIVHLATLLAVLWVLREDIVDILKGVFKKDDKGGLLGWKIVVATLPVVVFGVVVSGTVDSVRTLPVVAANLAIWGAVLWAADWYAERVNHKVKNVKDLSWSQAMVIGLFQAIALIPGSSRSGLTITAGLFSGVSRKTAARFSFLLGIPAIAGAGLFAAVDAAQHGLSTSVVALVAGFIAAFISGALAIKLLFKFLERADYRWFAGYRIIIGTILFLIAVL